MQNDKTGTSIPKSISIVRTSPGIQQSLQNSTVASQLTGNIGSAPVGPPISEPILLQYPSLDLLQSKENSNGISQLTGSSGAVPHPVVQSLGYSNGVSLLTESSAVTPAPVVVFPAIEPSPPLSPFPLAYHLGSTPTMNKLGFQLLRTQAPAALSAQPQHPTTQAAAEPIWASSGQYCRILYLDQDDESLSPYQSLVRKQIEVFQATVSSLQDKSQGRNKPIVLNQIGIRCRHCGRLPGKERAKGAVFFPSQLDGMYQTAQNMANKHLLHDCRVIPAAIREELFRIRFKEKGGKTLKSAYGGGRHYWADGLRVLGVVESPDRRLMFASAAT
jgi:hypothetical protein